MVQIQNLMFSLQFNVNIPVTIKHSYLIFSVTILDINSEGTVSRMCYIWPGFYLMECGKHRWEKMA